jgi:hypothetical protein
MRFVILPIAALCGVVGAITSQAGPGLFLQKKDQLVVCFVSETKTSKSVTTQYCKPVE